MWEEINSENKHRVFSEHTQDRFFATISAEMTAHFKTDPPTKEKPIGVGAFIIQNVPAEGYGTKDCWIDYDWEFVMGTNRVGGFDVQIRRIVIFDPDCVPDTVLDRYNELKKFKHEHLQH